MRTPETNRPVPRTTAARGPRPAGSELIDGLGALLWPDPRRGPWGIRGNFATVDGRAECVGLVIWRGAKQDPDDPALYHPLSRASLAAIRAGELRALPFAAIIDRLRRRAASDFGPPVLAHVERLLERGIDAEQSPWDDRGKIGAPRRYRLSHFVAVAETYLAAWDAGDQPTRAVADKFQVSRSAAAKWVARARSDELELLTPAEHGKPGARPGKRLLKIRKDRPDA